MTRSAFPLVPRRMLLLALAGSVLASVPVAAARQDPDQIQRIPQNSMPMEDRRSRPVKPPTGEKNVTMLFSGKAADLATHWIGRNGQPVRWPVANGAMTSRGGDIRTKDTYRDFRLHVEFKVPYMPEGKGQGRGNSGVYVQGRYEIQVLDSYGVPHPGKGECGAVYNIKAPLVNATKPPLQWQTYDMFYRAPRGDEATGKVTEPGSLTILQNGIIIHAGTQIDKVTGGAIDNNLLAPGPILLQDHGNAMQYRNIWIAPLPEKTPDYYESPEPRKG